MALALVVTAMNVGLWWWSGLPDASRDGHVPIRGFALSAFQRHQSPFTREFPSGAQIDADLGLLHRYTGRVRTYSARQSPQLYRLAQRKGLEVMAGADINMRLNDNEREIERLIALARRYPSTIPRVIVGNEVVFRHALPTERILAYLDRVRARVKQPVSIAEPDYIWLKHPELARHVDFITIHVFPFWSGAARQDAVAKSLGTYDEVRRAFPRKHVVVGEIGWPSGGVPVGRAVPSISNEATFVRDWAKAAMARHIDYYLLEAFDQPWKARLGEGRTGAHWGAFDVYRRPKFSVAVPVIENTGWQWKSAVAGLPAVAAMTWFALRFSRLKVAGRFFIAILIQLVCGLAVWSAILPFAHQPNWIDWAVLVLLFPALLSLLAILLINGFEFTEVLWHRRWRRHAGLLRPDPPEHQPFVSIHLPCHNEPPEMVIDTLDSLAALEYDAFEVLVLDNNTEDPAIWKPVEEHCAGLGSRFRFHHLEPWPGYKAGALNFGLLETDPRAEVVAVVDADYVVRADWLSALTGYFHDPKVGVVQCPQAHREYESNPFRRMASWEYDGFFRIGMHHRNERNAIIQHGTMTMVRRSALEDTGGWSEWTICEDAELGFRMMHAGHELVYVDELMGKGLTAADFTAYKGQRYRWAFGAMQILKRRRHWIFRRGPLNAGQRFHFLTGWFGWFADGLHLAFTLMAICWTAAMLALPQSFSLPMRLFLYPVIGFFFARAFFGIVLYRARVPCGWNDTLMAALAGMGLSHTVARGVLHGLARRHAAFVVTVKSRRPGGGNGGRLTAFTPVREEAALAVALALCATAMALRPGTHSAEGTLWMFLLVVQSIPYASALAGAWIAHRARDRTG